MTMTTQRPRDQETWGDWLQRRTQEECRWVAFGFYRDGEMLCTRENAAQAARDFGQLCLQPHESLKVVGERKDGSSHILGYSIAGLSPSGEPFYITGSPWFLRAAGL